MKALWLVLFACNLYVSNDYFINILSFVVTYLTSRVFVNKRSIFNENLPKIS